MNTRFDTALPGGARNGPQRDLLRRRGTPCRPMSKTFGVLGGVFFLLAALPAPLRPQAPDLDRVLAGYSPSEAAHLEAVITRPRWDGFPTDLLIVYAAEGTAKGVSVDRLVVALEAYAGRIDQAHDILGGRASTASLEAAADVLGRSVPEDVVRRVAAANPRDDHLTASMVALGDLVAAGVPPEEAEGLLLDAASRRQANDEVLGLPAQVRRWIRQGYQPTDAAAEVKRSMDFPRQPDGTIDRYNRPPQQPPF